MGHYACDMRPEWFDDSGTSSKLSNRRTKTMTNQKNWGISLQKNVRIPFDVDTKSSTYKAIAFKVFRKFTTRDEARQFKRSYGKPVSIINLQTANVVR